MCTIPLYNRESMPSLHQFALTVYAGADTVNKDENDLSASFPKPHFWYYYRIPPEHIDYWSSDIAWLEKIAEKRGISLFL